MSMATVSILNPDRMPCMALEGERCHFSTQPDARNFLDCAMKIWLDNSILGTISDSRVSHLQGIFEKQKFWKLQGGIGAT
jgi:hypothetical protein